MHAHPEETHFHCFKNSGAFGLQANFLKLHNNRLSRLHEIDAVIIIIGYCTLNASAALHLTRLFSFPKKPQKYHFNFFPLPKFAHNHKFLSSEQISHAIKTVSSYTRKYFERNSALFSFSSISIQIQNASLLFFFLLLCTTLLLLRYVPLYRRHSKLLKVHLFFLFSLSLCFFLAVNPKVYSKDVTPSLKTKTYILS